MKSNRDLFVFIVCVIWLAVNIYAYFNVGNCYLSNGIFVVFWAIVILCDNTISKFHNWLNKKTYDGRL